MTHKEALLEKILSKKAVAGIVGLGYVGLPLAVEFGRAGFSVVGFDVIEEKISQLNQGKSYIQDVPDTVIAPLVENGLFKATNDFPSWPRWTRLTSASLPRCGRQRPGHEFHRKFDRADRQVSAPGNTRNSRIDHLPRHDR